MPAPVISGVVQDPSGAIIANAHVQLRRANGTVVANAKTGENGRFDIPQPAPGDFRLLVSIPGFDSLTQTLQITRNPVPALVLKLKLGDVSTVVNVTADRETELVAPENNADSPAVSSSDMMSIPIYDNDVVSTMSAFLDSGAMNETGATLVVDGVETSTVGVAPSAIQSVSINQDPYSAYNRTPGRGQVEVTTKAAADHYHGAFTFTFRDSAFNASNYFAVNKPPEQRRVYEGYLTGPVARSRSTSFLLSVDRQEEDITSQVLAIMLPQQQGTIGTPPVNLAPQNVPSPTRSTDITFKVSHDYNAHHSAFVLYRFHDSSMTNQGVGAQIAASAGSVSYQFDQDITYHDDLTIAPNKLNQLNLRFERNADRTVSDQQTPQIIVQGIATFGGAQADQFNTENNPDITDAFTWTLSKPISQQLRFGIQIPNLGRRILEDHTDRQGIYTYGTLPFCNANGSTICPSALCTQANPGACNPVAAYQQNIPSTFQIQQGPSRFETVFAQPAAFFLDQIQATKRLTITPGLRYDFQNALSNTKNGFLPRLSVAYLLDKKHALVLRTGGGMYLRRVGVNIGQDYARYQTPIERSLLLTTNLCNPIASCNTLANDPPTLFTMQPNLKSPMQAYFSISLERQITKTSTLSIGYNGFRAWHALRSIDANAPLPPFNNPARPNPNYAQIRELQSQGYQESDGLVVTYRGRIRRFYTGSLQYTVAHADDNTEYSFFTPQNQYNPNNEWSRAAYDQRQRLALIGTLYPEKPLNLGFGFYNYTPTPYTITTGTDNYLTGLYNARPAGVARNSVEGGSYQDIQVRLNYLRKLHPQIKDDARSFSASLSSFNTLNRPNFTSYVGVINSPYFMQPTAAQDPRRLQLALGFNF